MPHDSTPEENPNLNAKTHLHMRICDLLGCRYSILHAGMGGVARSELVAGSIDNLPTAVERITDIDQSAQAGLSRLHDGATDKSIPA